MALRKVQRVLYTARQKLLNNYLPLYWCNANSNKGNWGDEVNTFLCEKISGKQLIHTSKTYHRFNRVNYTVIGSILDNLNIHNAIVWGSGFKFRESTVRIKPLTITAVRGALTRDKLLKLGIDCPKIYGDPALLMPLFYNPTIVKKFKLGIIPHLVDKNSEILDNFKNDTQITIIDICSGITEFIDQIKSCEYIASSSLHGLIAADAYDIPSAWVSFSDKILGGDFKFLDYFSSVGRTETQAMEITKQATIEQILTHISDYKLNIDLDTLFNACPFKAQ